MLRKDHEFKWTIPTKFSFDQIKKAISEAPILANLDYSKPFSIFSFASDTTFVVVLLQKNDNEDD